MPITTITGPFGQEIKGKLLQQITSEGGVGFITEDGEGIITEDEIILAPGAGGNACCPVTVIDFVSTKTEITYNQELINKHGRTPQVKVFYLDEETGFYVGGAYSRVVFRGLPVEQIIIDHGGMAVGYVKLT